MTALSLYGYTQGLFSSRKLAKACEERIELYSRAGLIRLGHVALDGTKVKANASKPPVAVSASPRERPRQSPSFRALRCRNVLGCSLAPSSLGIIDAEGEMAFGTERSGRPAVQRDLACQGVAAVPGKRTLTEDLGSEAASAVTPQPRKIDYPHAARIEASSGTAIPGRAVVDAAACHARGVPAFTDGSITHFASEDPDVHVAAHEAAHVMQHAGITGDAGLGPEVHAQRVADAVATGQPALPWIGLGEAVAPAVRNYTVISDSEQASTGHWKIGQNAKVGDQGRTITPVAETHEAYADPALITEANRILKAKRSGVEIEPGAAGPSGPAPDGSGFKSTVKVKYKIVGDPKRNEQYPHDCGQAARETMGVTGKDNAPRAVYKNDAGERKQTSASKSPAQFRDEIYIATGLGTTAAEARAKYESMSAADRDAYDKKHGINRYAAPGVGEAFTRVRNDHMITDWSDAGYNFHWGGVIMVAGEDRVTFENYVDPEAESSKNDAWYFATYGPPSKPGQTWHEQWAAGVGGEDKLGTTVAAASSPDPSPFTSAAATMTTADLVKRLAATVDTAEKMALESELGDRKLEVTVKVVKAQEGPDNVYVKAIGGKTHQTRELKLRGGQSHTFLIPVGSLLPIKDRIAVKVFDADWGPDDMISHISFQAPFKPQVDNRPWDDAEYHTTVKFDR